MLLFWYKYLSNYLSKQKFINSEQIADYICAEFAEGDEQCQILIPEIVRQNMIDALTTENGMSYLILRLLIPII